MNEIKDGEAGVTAPPLTDSEVDALLRLYTTINHPAGAGPVWVKYRRQAADAMLDVLRQVLSRHGVEFRPRGEAGSASPKAEAA